MFSWTLRYYPLRYWGHLIIRCCFARTSMLISRTCCNFQKEILPYTDMTLFSCWVFFKCFMGNILEPKHWTYFWLRPYFMQFVPVVTLDIQGSKENCWDGVVGIFLSRNHFEMVVWLRVSNDAKFCSCWLIRNPVITGLPNTHMNTNQAYTRSVNTT